MPSRGPANESVAPEPGASGGPAGFPATFLPPASAGTVSRYAMIMVRQRGPQGDAANSGARFAPGQLVRHRRYGYRGVVVAFDLECQADASWYQSNKTQPRRKQPWYHVLVDCSAQATYAAQDSLVADHDPSPVQHPMLGAFFKAFREGWYERNDEPWVS
jgi:heat shock protein HspQ